MQSIPTLSGDWLDSIIDVQLLILPGVQAGGLHCRLRFPCPRHREQSNRLTVCRDGGWRRDKIWLLPSRNLLSCWRNKKHTHQNQTAQRAKLAERVESECQRPSLAATGVARRVSHCQALFSWVLQDHWRGTNSKFLTRLRDLV